MSRRLWEQLLTGQAPRPSARTRPSGRASSPRKRTTSSVKQPSSLTLEQVRQLDAGVPEVQARDILLLGKPRMTRRDRWQKRPAVLRYRAMCDELRLSGLKLPSRFLLIAFLPMPASWPASRRRNTNGQPHLVKPDGDNVSKGCMDALSPSDSHHWDGRCIKLWAYRPRCVIVKAPVEENRIQALIAEHLPAEAG